jgi:type I restriction enzyme S subunit
MDSDFPLTFEDCAELVSNKIHPKDVAQDTPYIGLEHIVENDLFLNGMGLASDVDSQKSVFKKGDILFGKLRPYFRKVVIAPCNGICSTDIWVVRPKEHTDINFLFYWMASKQFVDDVTRASEGTRMPRAKWEIAAKFKKPKSENEKEIGFKLRILDKKIAINRQINQTLEAMAQAIFKSWFVDFEPVKAKIAAIEAGEDTEGITRAAMRAISGKTYEELDQLQAEQPDEYAQLEGTAELFPAAMVESEIGLIPEGWGVKKIGDYLNTISKTYPLKTVSEVIFLNTSDIQNGKVLHSNKSTVETLPGQAKKSIQKDDILYSEIRPENKRFAYVFFDGKEHVVSTKLMVLRPIADIDSKFLYVILTQQETIDFLQMMAESRSGTFPQITFNVISQVEFFGPKDNTIIHIFSKSILAPFMQERYLKDEENIQLSNIRDTLLPKLLSGEISVGAAEFAEE